MSVTGVVDYGMGNLRSVQKGIEKAGFTADICSRPEALESYDGLVLPGVGAFGDAMDHLIGRDLAGALLDCVRRGRPLLGICLGMQLLFEYSEEHGHNEGLGVIPGGVHKLPNTVKVPHTGWNAVRFTGEPALFAGIESGSRFYFVHSFYCAPESEEWTIGETPYGLDFTSAIGKGNIWGLQFHPEKSSLLGLKILENFGSMVREQA